MDNTYIDHRALIARYINSNEQYRGYSTINISKLLCERTEIYPALEINELAR